MKVKAHLWWSFMYVQPGSESSTLEMQWDSASSKKHFLSEVGKRWRGNWALDNSTSGDYGGNGNVSFQTDKNVLSFLL